MNQNVIDQLNDLSREDAIAVLVQRIDSLEATLQLVGSKLTGLVQETIYEYVHPAEPK